MRAQVQIVPGLRPAAGGFHRARDVAGFTLLELLVTLTILAAMAGMLFGSFRMSVKAWNRGDRLVEGVQRFRIMAELWRRQLSCAYALDIQQWDPLATADPLTGNPILPTAKVSGPRTAGPGRMAVPFFKGTLTEVKFTGLYPLRPYENAGLLVIRQTVERDPEGSGVRLMERESRYIGGSLASLDHFSRAEEKAEMMFDHLEEVRFQYLGVDPITGAAGWEDSWDSEAKDGLPKAVALEIRLTEDPGGMGLKHRFVASVVAGPFRSRLRDAGMGQGLFGLQGMNQPREP